MLKDVGRYTKILRQAFKHRSFKDRIWIQEGKNYTQTLKKVIKISILEALDVLF